MKKHMIRHIRSKSICSLFAFSVICSLMPSAQLEAGPISSLLKETARVVWQLLIAKSVTDPATTVVVAGSTAAAIKGGCPSLTVKDFCKGIQMEQKITGNPFSGESSLPLLTESAAVPLVASAPLVQVVPSAPPAVLPVAPLPIVPPKIAAPTTHRSAASYIMPVLGILAVVGIGYGCYKYTHNVAFKKEVDTYSTSAYKKLEKFAGTIRDKFVVWRGNFY